MDTTKIEVTNIKAKDGTSSATIADSTGVVTIPSSVLTTTDINGGTIDNATIGATTPAAITGTTITANTNFVGNVTGNVTGTVSSITNHDTSDLSEGTNLYHTTERARASVSVTDSGGDGSLAYNSTSGVITYTGPSAAETRAHFSAGTGVGIAAGEISIGQAVGTTDNLTFGNISGTAVRDGMSKGDESKRKAYFKKVYGKFDPKIFNLISGRLSKLESVMESFFQSINISKTINEASFLNLGKGVVDDGEGFLYGDMETYKS